MVLVGSSYCGSRLSVRARDGKEDWYHLVPPLLPSGRALPIRVGPLGLIKRHNFPFCHRPVTESSGSIAVLLECGTSCFFARGIFLLCLAMFSSWRNVVGNPLWLISI